MTGGSRGIGYATARALLEAQARVALCARDRGRLDHALAALRPLGEVLGLVADVRAPAQCRDLVDKTARALGSIDGLVNNAGVTWVGPFAAQDHADIDTVIDVNLEGLMHMTRAVLPGMLGRGAGTIVNVASGAGLSGFPRLVGYSAAKFGVVGFTEALDQEVGAQGVRVYAVCPGKVATDMQVLYSGARVGMAPERVAAAIVSLLGPRPPVRTGRCLTL